MTGAFIHGFLLAFGLILPLGAQNIFVFNQGVYHCSWVKALPVVLMAGLCDTLLILLAVLGVSLLVLKIAWFKLLLSVIGVGFLLYIAFVTWRRPVDTSAGNDSNQWPLRRQLIFTASVSLLNPHAILDTIGVIGTSSLAYTTSQQRLGFTAAAILVSWLWFFSLMRIGQAIGSLSNFSDLQVVVNRISAVIIVINALVLIKTIV